MTPPHRLGTATSTVRNELSGGLYAFTLGPFFELPLGDKWQIDLGIGAVAAHRQYSFAESTTITAPVGVPGVQRSGDVRSTDWLFGAGVRLGVGYNLRACWKTLGNRRVRARGLQDLAEKPVACRPGALTGRVFKHALSDMITLEFGVDYQHLGSASQTVNGKTAKLDLENVIGFAGGVRWRF